MSQRHYFRPEQFLEIASQIFSNNKYDTKAKSRTAVGRAYYAAFLEAKRKLSSLGQSFNEEEKIHGQVIAALTLRRQDLGDQLSTLFEKRVDADYKIDKDVGKQTANTSIRIATLLLRELNSLK